MRALVVLAALTLAATAPLAPLGAQQRQTIGFESTSKGGTVRPTAEIHWPDKPGPLPAMVIHHGSGGVGAGREGRFAREMVAMGVAAVVIDSFGPRGVVSTVTDQDAVPFGDFNRDAVRILPVLAATPRIDRTRIGVMGFSKGGTSALLASHEELLAAAGVPAGLRYALHVPFYPGCNAHYYKPRTTGAPIHMLLGGADTYTGVEPCTEYAADMKAAGANIEVTIYPGARHGFDGGRDYYNPRGENYRACVFKQGPDGIFIERKSGVATSERGVAVPGAFAKAVAGCMTKGVEGGGQAEASTRSMADLKGYVRRHLLGN